jgi:hypothetical protein
VDYKAVEIGMSCRDRDSGNRIDRKEAVEFAGSWECTTIERRDAAIDRQWRTDSHRRILEDSTRTKSNRQGNDARKERKNERAGDYYHCGKLFRRAANQRNSDSHTTVGDRWYSKSQEE